jgi:hypothetical protein
LRRPLVLAVVVLLAGAGLVWLVWAGFLQGPPQVQSQLATFQVHGQHRAEARFTVIRRDRSVRATCVLTAYAADHAVVGEVAVPVGPSRPATASVDQTLRTDRMATTVDLVGCTTRDQHKPR